MSPTPPPPSSSKSTTTPGTTRHAVTAADKQKMQLERLLKDPAKPAFIPTPPQDKTIRPAREMMKNVQGSSAGAGSGEFHVYKAGRRREYERLKLLDDQVQKEKDEADFAQKRAEAEAIADAKTSKNRSKRQKKKERARAHTSDSKDEAASSSEVPIKKRRVVNGKELIFKRPGEDSDEEDAVPAVPQVSSAPIPAESAVPISVIDEQRITIHED